MESVVVLLFYDSIRGVLGLVGGLWSIVSIMEYPAETINIREGMGTAVRNVKHTKGWHFVIFGAWLNVGTRTAMRHIRKNRIIR